MRRIVVLMHVSLDGFVGDKNGGIDWITVDEEMFDLAGQLTDQSDTVIYGRVTYQMMEAYWPSAGKQPNPSKHDIEHSEWYNKVPKVILSTTMNPAGKPDVQVISSNLADEIQKIKNQKGKGIVIFGSPSSVHSLMQFNLIDEFWLLINPVLVGDGIPMFKDLKEKKFLTLTGTKIFRAGVVALHYTLKR
jgi:dihydrofolate reductase